MKKNTATTKNIVSPNLETQLMTFLQLVARSSEFAKNLKATLAAFDTLFSNNNAYQYILKRAHLLNEAGAKLQVFPLQDASTFQLSFFVAAKACPQLFQLYLDFNVRANNFGLAAGKINHVEEEYCLLLDRTGATTAVIYCKDKKIDVYDFYNNFEILALDLPLVMYGLIKGAAPASTKLALATLVAKNPTSTLANIFAYIKTDGKAVAALPKKLKLLAKEIATLFAKLEANATNNSIISNNIQKEFGYSPKAHLPPYTISSEAGEVAIKAIYTKDNVTAYNFKNYEEVFPAVITVKGSVVTPYFLRNEFFHDETKAKKLGENLYCLKKNKGLIPLAEKVAELGALEQEKISADFEASTVSAYSEYAQYISQLDQENGRFLKKFELSTDEAKATQAFKKRLTEQLSGNLELVLATLERHIVYCSREALFLKQEKFLLKTQTTVTSCKKRAEEIAGTLGKIYKNEIVLENL